MLGVIDTIIHKIRTIPPLSDAANALMRLIEKPDHTVDELVSIVSKDPMLVGKLIKIANCAAFARRTPVESIGGAVSYLGDKMVVGIALGASASALYGAPLKGYESAEGMLWLHSLRTAIAAREIAHFTHGRVNGGIAYTAGLLHDIGKALITTHLEEHGQEIMAVLENDCLDFLSAEKKITGTNHCEIGGIIAEHWNLPGSLQAAIKHHHAPSQTDEQYKPLCYVIHLSDIIAMMAGIGTGTDTLRYTFFPDYEQYVPIGRDELDRLIMMVGIEYGRIEQGMGAV